MSHWTDQQKTWVFACHIYKKLIDDRDADHLKGLVKKQRDYEFKRIEKTGIELYLYEKKFSCRFFHILYLA